MFIDVFIILAIYDDDDNNDSDDGGGELRWTFEGFYFGSCDVFEESV